MPVTDIRGEMSFYFFHGIVGYVHDSAWDMRGDKMAEKDFLSDVQKKNKDTTKGE